MQNKQTNSVSPMNNHSWQNTVCICPGSRAQEHHQLAPVPQKVKTRDLP